MSNIIKDINGNDSGSANNGRAVIRTGGSAASAGVSGRVQTLNAPFFSQDAHTVFDGLITRLNLDSLVPAGYQQITDVSSAVGLTVPDGADSALIQAVTQNVRWRDDGTNPTTSTGNQLAAGESMYYTGDLSAIKFIEETASAELNISYYGA